jgi:RHS repeat-associated protein
MLRSEIFPDAADSSDRETYGYNRQGQVKQKKDRNGTVHDYLFDLLGRSTADAATVIAAGVDDAVRQIGLSYEVRGMVQKVTSYSDLGTTVLNQVQNAYNGFAQLAAQYQAHAGAVNTGTTPKVQYEHVDGTGNTARPTKIIYPNGRVLDIEYAVGHDAKLSRVTDLKISGESAAAVAYTYFGLGSVAQTSYPQPGIVSAMASAGSFPGFDRFGRIIDLPWTKSSTDLVHLQYGYDRSSNRTFRKDVVAQAAGKNFDELYQYDGLQRLRNYHQGRLTDGSTRIESPGVQQGWVLDATGNWRNFTQFDSSNSSNTLDQQRTSNRFNEITDITATVGTVWAMPTYDRNGNTKRIPKPTNLGDSLFVVYDAWNRLVRILDVFVVVEHAYDGLNRRIVAKSYGSGGGLLETRHLYYSDAWQVLEERVDSGATAKAQYVWGLRYIDDCVLRDRNTSGSGLNERLYAMQDANWNVVAIANAAGAVQERYGYTPYGSAHVMDDSLNSRNASAYDWRHLNQGLRLAVVLGLCDNRRRWLSPSLGCFISHDTLPLGGGDYNRCRYCVNSPLNSVDPSGQTVAHNKWYGSFGHLHGSKKEDILLPPDISGTWDLDASEYYFPKWLYDKWDATTFSSSAHPRRDQWFGVAITLKDRLAGQACGGGKGDRVWVVFLSVHEEFPLNFFTRGMVDDEKDPAPPAGE